MSITRSCPWLTGGVLQYGHIRYSGRFTDLLGKAQQPLGNPDHATQAVNEQEVASVRFMLIRSGSRLEWSAVLQKTCGPCVQPGPHYTGDCVGLPYSRTRRLALILSWNTHLKPALFCLVLVTCVEVVHLMENPSVAAEFFGY